MSLFRSPTPRPIEPTSKRRHSPIYNLNDDVLLNIFHFYQLHIQDEYEGKNGILMPDWGRQRWWYKLAQVSRLALPSNDGVEVEDQSGLASWRPQSCLRCISKEAERSIQT
jgi:hypothetical protein